MLPQMRSEDLRLSVRPKQNQFSLKHVRTISGRLLGKSAGQRTIGKGSEGSAFLRSMSKVLDGIGVPTGYALINGAGEAISRMSGKTLRK